MAAPDQSLFPGNHQVNIIKNSANPICRLCEQYLETTNHLMSGCPLLTLKEYKYQQDKIRQYITRRYVIITDENWYEHHPETVTESHEVTILWDFIILTDRHTKANRPVIAIKDNKQKKNAFSQDMAIPIYLLMNMTNISKDFEIGKMWHFKTYNNWSPGYD